MESITVYGKIKVTLNFGGGGGGGGDGLLK